MATVTFSLHKRKLSTAYSVRVKYFDGSSSGTLREFYRLLIVSVPDKHWKYKHDKKTNIETWVKDSNPKSKSINRFLRSLKLNLFKIRDHLVTEDQYGNKIYPTVEEIRDVYDKSIDKNGILNFNPEIVDNLTRRINGKDVYDITLNDLIADYIEIGGKDGNITKGTSTTYKYAKKHLDSYAIKRKKELTLDLLTRDRFNDIKTFLINSKKSGGIGLGNNTARKYLTKMRDVYNYYREDYPHMHAGFKKGKYPSVIEQCFFALKEELEVLKYLDFEKVIIESTLEKFYNAEENGESYWNTEELAKIMQRKPDTIRKNVKQYGLPAELITEGVIQKYRFDKEKVIRFVKETNWTSEPESIYRTLDALNRARDWYCFASEAPVRFSDLVRLDPNIHLLDSVNRHGDKIKIIKLHPGKTIKHRALQEFPLSNYCLSIIDKYKNQVRPDQLLPINMSNTKTNEMLHKALRISGLFNHELIDEKIIGEDLDQKKVPRWKLLKFHSSRDNYGSYNMFIGRNIMDIMMELGHKKLTTTQGYIGLYNSHDYQLIYQDFISKHDLPKLEKVVEINSTPQAYYPHNLVKVG